MLKRSLDFLAAAVGLAVLSPVFLLIAILVKLTSRGPVFYKATRVGLGGELFVLIKFRSMIINADQIGPKVTGASDPRITPLGRFLRQTKLDELPQLINVLRGDMSIVGPRPEDPRFVELYTKEQRQILSVRPGITSPASIKFRDEEAILTGEDWEQHYIENVLPVKIAIDLEYVQKSNLWRDLVIIFCTLKLLLPKANRLS